MITNPTSALFCESRKRFRECPITSKYGVIACWFCFVLGFLFLIPSSTEAKEKKQNPAEPYALLMITCVNDRGLSLPGTGIVVQMQLNPEQKPKKTQWEGTSDARGESAFRLPAGKNSFLIKARREGYRPQEKMVTFVEEERQDILFTMEPLAAQP